VDTPSAGKDQTATVNPVINLSSAQTEVKKSSYPSKKTQPELDEELRLKLEGISGEGGSSGIEYEGGKAVGLKRGVKDNMFRVI